MATTVGEAFTKLRANLQITDLQEDTVSTRQKHVRAAVEDELTVKESFLTGSYRRQTMIAPVKTADVDIFVVLDSEYYERDGQTKLLEKVKRVLRKTYTKTPEISRNGQAVTITFSDFAVDVVPAFYRKGGGFIIPSTSGVWISTDPRKHTEVSSARNAARSGMLVPLVKMLKCWNREISSHFRTFHIEVMAWEIFEFTSFSSYDEAAKIFFDEGRLVVRRKNLDPAGYGGDVGAYISTQARIDAAVSRLETAYNRAVKARTYASDGYSSRAIGEWRNMFGENYFPSYG